MEKFSDDIQKTLNNFIIDVKKKNEYLPEDEERSKEGKRVEDATDSKIEAKSSELMSVSQSDLCMLVADIRNQLRKNSPKPKVSPGTGPQARVTESLREELKQTRQQIQNDLAEISYLRTRCETAVTECQQEKQENIRLRHEVEVLTQQLSQQSEYCSGLGAACCTLLWRVSRSEDTIQSILIGSKVEEFLTLVSNTLNSYVITYKSDWPGMDSDESQFVHGLCGVITNIAASAFGRDFLITNPRGRQLVDTFISVLEEAPHGKSARLKNLILMALYNLSINQNGIKYLSSKRGIIKLLAWLLQEEVATENQVNSLRLVQSLISVESNLNLIHQLLEELPRHVLQELEKDKNREIREFAREISSDIQSQVRHEQ
uniref:Heat shock factor 2-binding protein n=1 Tax=Magallana gigas TaxID=29159 RepID=A0A8W8HLQ4_MAGGI